MGGEGGRGGRGPGGGGTLTARSATGAWDDARVDRPRFSACEDETEYRRVRGVAMEWQGTCLCVCRGYTYRGGAAETAAGWDEARVVTGMPPSNCGEKRGLICHGVAVRGRGVRGGEEGALGLHEPAGRRRQ